MCRIIKNSHGYQLKNQKIFLPTESPCAVRSQWKLIIWSSQWKLIMWSSIIKVSLESPKFLKRI